MPTIFIKRAPAQTPDEHLVFFHEETANNPQAWYYTAETLIGSAEHIRGGLEAGPAARRLERVGYMDTHYNSYGLLLGCGLECILKGLWAAKGGRIMDGGKFVGVPGADDHDLWQLAKAVDAGISNHQEQNVVNRLSFFITAAGRYPVPRRPQEWAPRNVPGRGKVHPGYFSKKDWDVGARVVHRLLGELKSKMYGPDS